MTSLLEIPWPSIWYGIRLNWSIISGDNCKYVGPFSGKTSEKCYRSKCWERLRISCARLVWAVYLFFPRLCRRGSIINFGLVLDSSVYFNWILLCYLHFEHDNNNNELMYYFAIEGGTEKMFFFCLTFSQLFGTSFLNVHWMIDSIEWFHN